MNVLTLKKKKKTKCKNRAVFLMAFWDILGVAHHNSTKMQLMSLQGSFWSYHPASGGGTAAELEHAQASMAFSQLKWAPAGRGKGRMPGWEPLLPWFLSSAHSFRVLAAQQASCWAVKSFQTNLCVYRDSRAAGNISEYQSGSRNWCIRAKPLSTPAMALSSPFLPHPLLRFLLCICCGFLHTESFWGVIVKSFKNQVKPEGVKWKESYYLRNKWKRGEKEEKEQMEKKRKGLGRSSSLVSLSITKILFFSVLWRQSDMTYYNKLVGP